MTNKTSKKPAKTKKTPPKKGKKLNPVYRIVLVLLSVIGIAVMGYLTKVHYDDSGGAFCDLSEKLSCHAVNTSEYAELLGIPVSILGILFFVTILGLIVIKGYNQETLKRVVFFSLAFLAPALYMTALELFVIKSICLFCELSKVIVVVIIITALLALRPLKDAKKLITSGIVLGLLLTGGTFMAHRISSQEIAPDKYVEFAKCLTDKGCVMYGSVTCQFCGRQRDMFGEAFEFIHEIECDPRNPNAQARLCVAKEVEHTPTWIREDENGNTISRLEAGMQSLEALAEWSGCPLENE